MFPAPGTRDLSSPSIIVEANAKEFSSPLKRRMGGGTDPAGYYRWSSLLSRRALGYSASGERSKTRVEWQSGSKKPIEMYSQLCTVADI